jgi:hypothetical protein
MIPGIGALLLLVTVPSAPPSDQEALQAFNDSITQYVALHHRLETAIAPLALSADAVTLYVAPTTLRERLLRARTGAREGKFFTARAAAIFKRLIARTSRGDYTGLLRATHEDRDELGRAVVNDRWPGTALTTMPPDLLAALPPLPGELEFRFVHRDLVLWDVRADLIDVLRDAIPSVTGRLMPPGPVPSR